jgi:uncharacterized protein YciI
MRYLAVTRTRGAAWDHSLSLDEQEGFAAHAGFMNELVAADFVVLGGPLDDGEEILLIVDAPSEDAVRVRLAADPWTRAGLLEMGDVREWEILLGG